MDATIYKSRALRTAKRFPTGIHISPHYTDLLHAVLGLSGEAGELIDAVKKNLIYGKLLDIENYKEELGDILWYMALAIDSLGSSFEEVMQMNLEKLKKRYPEKYTDELASTRLDKIIPIEPTDPALLTAFASGEISNQELEDAMKRFAQRRAE